MLRIEVVDDQIEAALKVLKKQMLEGRPVSGDEEAGVLRQAIGEAEAQTGAGAEEAAPGLQRSRAADDN